eukprot:snap_masked-scaffold_47-processed-gene-1.68-mRNA-1 protein AED:1.00 eAED:1.00 QI:0/0/0/0/1/1/2/0/68
MLGDEDTKCLSLHFEFHLAWMSTTVALDSADAQEYLNRGAHMFFPHELYLDVIMCICGVQLRNIWALL